MRILIKILFSFFSVIICLCYGGVSYLFGSALIELSATSIVDVEWFLLMKIISLGLIGVGILNFAVDYFQSFDYSCLRRVVKKLAL